MLKSVNLIESFSTYLALRTMGCVLPANGANTRLTEGAILLNIFTYNCQINELCVLDLLFYFRNKYNLCLIFKDLLGVEVSPDLCFSVFQLMDLFFI